VDSRYDGGLIGLALYSVGPWRKVAADQWVGCWCVGALFIVVGNAKLFLTHVSITDLCLSNQFYCFRCYVPSSERSVEFMLRLELLCCYGNLLSAVSHAAELISSK
jgi:hypothetical protein